MIRPSATALSVRLAPQLNSGDDFLRFMTALTASERKRAGAVLSETLLPSLTQKSFDELFLSAVKAEPKAYLVTFLHAWVKGYQSGRLTLSEEVLRRFSDFATEIDRRKTLTTVLPVLRTHEEIALLMTALLPSGGERAIAYLLVVGTLPAFYRLFLLLIQADLSKEDLRTVALQAMKNGDARSLRFAELLQSYFDLSPLPGRFGTTTEDYRLSRLDLGYETFCKEFLR